MSKGLQITLLTIGGIVAGAALLLIGMNIGRAAAFSSNVWPDGFSVLRADRDYPYSGSMMDSLALDFRYGNSMLVSGMMGYAHAGVPYGSGMMGQFSGETLLGIQPVEVGEARLAVEYYLEELDLEDLEVSEVMVFDNHAYVQVFEQSSGIGALELLVDPMTLAVYPEHGPAMMWNLKYSPMSGFGGFGMMGMMGAFNFGSEDSMLEMMEEQAEVVDFADLPVGPQEAVESAQRYLDAYLPGAEADDTPDPFYGYYTLHIERDGEVVGMLSVNGTTAQVWPHTWHGELLEMSDHE
jgi:hypothetical protein